MLNNETIVWDFKTLWSWGGGGGGAPEGEEASFTSLFSVFVVINGIL